VTRTEIKDEIRRIPLSERVDLLEELWREAEQEEPKLLDWQRELLDERFADAAADPEGWVAWADARRRLERLLVTSR
jgi:hypothetical protein